MQCRQCGCDLNGDARFCNRCGARMEAAETFAGVGASGFTGGPGSFGQPWQPAPAGAASSVVSAYLIPKEEMQRRRVAGNLQPLGITWCVWGVYRLITGIAASFAVHTLSHGGMWSGEGTQFLPGLFHLLVPVIALSTGVMAALSLLTGYSMLSRKPWARTLAIIMAILSLIKLPLGTTLGIYTLWALAPRAAGVEYERLCGSPVDAMRK